MRVVARSWSRRSSLSGTADRLPDFTKVKQVTPDQFLASRTNDPDRGWTGTPLVTAVPRESKSRGIFWSGDASETVVTPRTVSGSPCRGTCGPPDPEERSAMTVIASTQPPADETTATSSD